MKSFPSHSLRQRWNAHNTTFNTVQCRRMFGVGNLAPKAGHRAPHCGSSSSSQALQNEISRTFFRANNMRICSVASLRLRIGVPYSTLQSSKYSLQSSKYSLQSSKYSLQSSKMRTAPRFELPIRRVLLANLRKNPHVLCTASTRQTWQYFGRNIELQKNGTSQLRSYATHEASLGPNLLKNGQQGQKRFTTLSFYNFWDVPQVADFREKIYESFAELGIVGRVYVAREGINAQISVPSHQFKFFLHFLQSTPPLDALPKSRLNFAINFQNETQPAFNTLCVKMRNQVVTGAEDSEFSIFQKQFEEQMMRETGKIQYLSAREWNEKMKDSSEEKVILDVRNVYESEIGHFEGAVCPDVVSYRESIPVIHEMLKGKESTNVMMYCTGGIRCEKASIELARLGFEKIYQLQGGIIKYARDVKEQQLENKFLGKNFCFDERLSEEVALGEPSPDIPQEVAAPKIFDNTEKTDVLQNTSSVISQCHHCGKASANQLNCLNHACHRLFIQCDDCAKEFQETCSSECFHVAHNLTPEKYAYYRKTKSGNISHRQRVTRTQLEKVRVPINEQDLFK